METSVSQQPSVSWPASLAHNSKGQEGREGVKREGRKGEEREGERQRQRQTGRPTDRPTNPTEMKWNDMVKNTGSKSALSYPSP